MDKYYKEFGYEDPDDILYEMFGLEYGDDEGLEYELDCIYND